MLPATMESLSRLLFYILLLWFEFEKMHHFPSHGTIGQDQDQKVDRILEFSGASKIPGWLILKMK
jgi:hypothetical protein